MESWGLPEVQGQQGEEDSRDHSLAPPVHRCFLISASTTGTTASVGPNLGRASQSVRYRGPPGHRHALPRDHKLGEVPLDGVEEESWLGRLQEGEEGVGGRAVHLHLAQSQTCNPVTFSMKFQAAPYLSPAHFLTSAAVPGS